MVLVKDRNPLVWRYNDGVRVEMDLQWTNLKTPGSSFQVPLELF